jgi:hypothetical protein
MNSNTNSHNTPKSQSTTAPAARKRARYDLPVLRPSMSRATLTRLLGAR